MAQSNLITGMLRGIAGRCPECGKGRLLRAYLKVAPTCDHCGHDNGQYPADDAPPYFTILIVGHLIVAPALCFSFIWTWPIGWVLLATLPAIMAATVLLLPRVKGAVIGAQWAIQHNDGAPLDDDHAAVWTPGDVRS
jgi:uncharacterized protein (DUF983 family)